MRASRGDKHISGSERLLDVQEMEDAVSQLLRRALDHPRGRAGHISITVQPVPIAQIRNCSLLPLMTHQVKNCQQGLDRARELLIQAGLKAEIVEQSMALLAAGPSPQGGVMRGAMLIDPASGARLEPDQGSGVRVSRMDLSPESRRPVAQFLSSCGLNNQRVIEAWILASKVALYPQIVAELCWSDDPDYVTGYVASSEGGYQRITHLKEAGSDIGGRIFFVKPATEVLTLINYLRHEPVLFRLPVNVEG